MENGNVKNPTYEELSDAYQQLVRQYQQLEYQYRSEKISQMESRLSILLDVIAHSDSYTKNIVDLAIYHVEQILAKPENDKGK